MLEAGYHTWSVCRERLQAAAGAQRTPRKCRLAVGTDCSGGDASVFAWKSLARCAAQDGILIDMLHELSSEDTRAKHCQRFIQMNHAPKKVLQQSSRATGSKWVPCFHAAPSARLMQMAMCRFRNVAVWTFMMLALNVRIIPLATSTARN